MTPKYLNSIPRLDFLKSFRNKAETLTGNFEWNFNLIVKSKRKILIA